MTISCCSQDWYGPCFSHPSPPCLLPLSHRRLGSLSFPVKQQGTLRSCTPYLRFAYVANFVYIVSSFHSPPKVHFLRLQLLLQHNSLFFYKLLQHNIVDQPDTPEETWTSYSDLSSAEPTSLTTAERESTLSALINQLNFFQPISKCIPLQLEIMSFTTEERDQIKYIRS